jgi:hypothetical protein
MRNVRAHHRLQDQRNVSKPYFLERIENITCYIDDEINFILKAKDPGGAVIHMSAFHIPLTANFKDNGDGTAAFRWRPRCRMRFCLIFTANNDRHHDPLWSGQQLVLVDVRERRNGG